MFTTNYRHMLAQVLCAGSASGGILESRTPDGSHWYISNSFGNNSTYPYSVGANLVTNTNAGIALGSGTTPPTVDDYAMEEQITSGISASIVRTYGDDDGSPWVTFDITVTNTGTRAVTISEVGYFQNLYTASSKTGSFSARSHMLDHTLLDEPVTIPAGEYAVIRYKLKTSIGA